MITEHELRSAIAECMGERNPNANTCIKLAAYYTILANLYPDNRAEYSNTAALPNSVVAFDSGSEFAEVIYGKSMNEVLKVIDELVAVVQVLKPSLYDGVIRKLREI